MAPRSARSHAGCFLSGIPGAAVVGTESERPRHMHLGADIGGTKTNLALVEAHAPQELVCEDHVSSRAFPDLIGLLRAFQNKSGLTAHTACLAVPGPVFAGRAELTHLNWICVEKEIA